MPEYMLALVIPALGINLFITLLCVFLCVGGGGGGWGAAVPEHFLNKFVQNCDMRFPAES